MLIHRLSFALLTLLLTSLLHAQSNRLDACRPPEAGHARSGLDGDAYEDYVRRFAARGGHLDETVKTIPVVVHVVYDSIGDSLSLERVQSQIEAMNNDFRRRNADTAMTREEFHPVAADMQVEFCLARRDPAGQATPGVVWHHVPGLTEDSVVAIKQRTQWAPARYLNIWVMPVIGGGYSSVPWDNFDEVIDGFQVGTRRFGTIGELDEGFTEGGIGTHEAGHYLGLRHTFEGGFVYLGQCSGVPCDSTGDYVCDTPLDWNLAWSAEQCEDGSRFCDDGSMFFTQSENFMAYGFDTCTNMFSLGQRIRVRATLDSLRAELVSEENLITTGCRTPTDVVDLQPSGRLRLYPQPTNGELTLEFAEAIKSGTASIYRLNGQQLFSQVLSDGLTHRLALPALPPGLYVLQVRSGKRVWVEKVMVWRRP